jgi:hypothetical protein
MKKDKNIYQSWEKTPTGDDFLSISLKAGLCLVIGVIMWVGLIYAIPHTYGVEDMPLKMQAEYLNKGVDTIQ